MNHHTALGIAKRMGWGFLGSTLLFALPVSVFGEHEVPFHAPMTPAHARKLLLHAVVVMGIP